MRSSCLALVTLVAVAACTTQQARRIDTAAPATATLAGASTTDAAAVRQAIDAINTKFAAAAVAGDTVALSAFYADDAIAMPANTPAQHGRAEISKGFAAMLVAMKPTTMKFQTQDLIVSGDYAIETGSYDVSSKPLQAAKPVHDVGKYLVVWKKQTDGSYKLLRDIGNSDLPPMK